METNQEELLAIDETVIAPNQSASIYIISEKGPFLPLNLVISEQSAKDVLVTDIAVGKNSQFISTGAVSADYFFQRGKVEDLRFDKLHRGGVMRVSVMNIGSKPASFSGAVRGELMSDEVRSDPPVQNRYVMGLGGIVVQPKANLVLKIQSQVGFKPDCFVMPKELSNLLKLTALRVVGETIPLPGGDLAGSLIKIHGGPSMKCSDWLVVELLNETDQIQRFHGAVSGTVA